MVNDDERSQLTVDAPTPVDIRALDRSFRTRLDRTETELKFDIQQSAQRTVAQLLHEIRRHDTRIQEQLDALTELVHSWDERHQRRLELLEHELRKVRFALQDTRERDTGDNGSGAHIERPSRPA